MMKVEDEGMVRGLLEDWVVVMETMSHASASFAAGWSLSEESV